MNYNDSTMKEYRNEKGQLHRTDGPALCYSNNTKEWFTNGLRHRTLVKLSVVSNTLLV
jgi:hypothetical protein